MKKNKFVSKYKTSLQRSRNMSRIKSVNTKPELAVRKALRVFGYKYRLHYKKLPGKPDIFIPTTQTAVFVNGCFWHQHKNCRRKSMPKNNTAYWTQKLKGNVARFKRQQKELKKLNVQTVIIWECECGDKKRLYEIISRNV